MLSLTVQSLFFAPGETMVQAPSRPVDGALCVANADMTFDTDGSLCTKVTNLKFVERQRVPNEKPVLRDPDGEVPEDYDVDVDPDDLFFGPGETLVEGPERRVDGAVCVANTDLNVNKEGALRVNVDNLPRVTEGEFKFVQPLGMIPNEVPILRDDQTEVPEDYDVVEYPDDLFFAPGETLVEGPERRVDGAVCVANADLNVNDEGALRVNVDNLPRVTEGDPMEEGEGILPGTDNILLSRDDRFNFTGGALNVVDVRYPWTFVETVHPPFDPETGMPAEEGEGMGEVDEQNIGALVVQEDNPIPFQFLNEERFDDGGTRPLRPGERGDRIPGVIGSLLTADSQLSLVDGRLERGNNFFDAFNDRTIQTTTFDIDDTNVSEVSWFGELSA